MDQSVIEHDCNVLGGLFQLIINDLKNGSSIWEDFLLKASKFQTQLKGTIAASTSFLDSFQKVADMATTTRGGTKEIGTALTRLCLRHRSVEAKLKSFSSTILDCLIIPLQDRIEEWKKSTIQLDKEHGKELKRLRQEMKKRQVCDSLITSNSFRSKKHSSRLGKSKYDFTGIYGTIGGLNNKSNGSNLSRSLDSEMECNERFLLFEELEKKAVRRALIEERSHFCLFVKFLRPVVEEEISMIQEIGHIQEIIESLFKLTTNPFDLPTSSETVIANLKLRSKHETTNTGWHFQTPPSSPSSLGSRKSSMCSISSYNSSSSGSTYGQTGHNKYLSLTHIPVSYANYDYKPEKSYNNGDCNQSGGGGGGGKQTAHEDLQFHLETGNNCETGTNNTIMISSTNPFLNSYTQATSDYHQNDGGGGGGSNPYSIQDSSVQSEGSITPTNYEQASLAQPEVATYGEVKSKSSKPPPAPPIRRTSSISNPNAITIGTLKSAAAIGGNYDQLCKNLSLYDEINVLTKSMNDINFTLKYTDFTNSTAQQPKSETKASPDFSSHSSSSELSSRKKPLLTSQNSKSFEEESSQLPLPAPPPEAFLDSPTAAPSTAPTSGAGNASSSHHHYNKITNVHREFLEQLNSKLSQSPLVHQGSGRNGRRRSSNQLEEKDNNNSGGGKRSSRSASTTRLMSTGSRRNPFECDNFQPGQTLIQKQQNAELAKAVASTALQRKQSVPDLNEIGSNSLKNRVTFSSSLNLSNDSFQVVEIQTQSTQQPIYASRSQMKHELQSLYGSVDGPIYSSERLAYHHNGFFNKL